MTELKRIAGRNRPAWQARAAAGTGAQHKGPGARPAAAESRRRGLKRYFLFSLGVSTMALGLAVTVGVLAVMQARPPLPGAGSFSTAVDGGPWFSTPIPPPEAPTILKAASLPPQTASSERARPEQQPARSGQPLLAAETVHVSKGRIVNVNITFYDCADQGFCGAMANGRIVYEGAAACSWNLQIGTRFVIEGDPTGRIYTCEDRGLLANTWVDIFWHAPADGWLWQSEVGRWGVIEIVELPGS